MSDRFDPTAVPVHPAATVMLVRDASPSGVPDEPSGIEVFMMRRTGNASFGAGMYVFPGGRVDDIDHADEIAPYCRGLDDASASAQLAIDAGGLAFWVAAVRECFEEAGVLLAEPRDGGSLTLRNEDRHAVHDGRLSLVALCRRDDLVLDLSNTCYVAHWVTPLGERRRFDTRFFLCEAPADQAPLHDDKETVDNLRFLEPHRTAAAALAAGAAIVDPPRILPKLRFDRDGKIVGISRPGDPDYDDL